MIVELKWTWCIDSVNCVLLVRLNETVCHSLLIQIHDFHVHFEASEQRLESTKGVSVIFNCIAFIRETIFSTFILASFQLLLSLVWFFLHFKQWKFSLQTMKRWLCLSESGARASAYAFNISFLFTFIFDLICNLVIYTS